MQDILHKHLSNEIGINLERPHKIDAAVLITADQQFFSVIDADQGYTHHLPYSSIVQVIEHPDGIDVGGLFEHKKFNLIIKVGHIHEFSPL